MKHTALTIILSTPLLIQYYEVIKKAVVEEKQEQSAYYKKKELLLGRWIDCESSGAPLEFSGDSCLFDPGGKGWYSYLVSGDTLVVDKWCKNILMKLDKDSLVFENGCWAYSRIKKYYRKSKK